MMLREERSAPRLCIAPGIAIAELPVKWVTIRHSHPYNLRRVESLG